MDPFACRPEDRGAGRLRSFEIKNCSMPMDAELPAAINPVPRSLIAERTTRVPEPAPAQRRRSFRFLDALEKPIELIIRLCGWSSIIGIVAIFAFIFKEAAPMVPKLDWVHFFTSPRWIPFPGAGNEASFGALALIVGTFGVTFIALLVAVPVGLGAAVYISEFAKGKVKETLKIVIELLAAIPSIVWGFIGLMVIGPIIKEVFSNPIDPVWGRVELFLLAALLALVFGALISLALPKRIAGWTRRAFLVGLPPLVVAGGLAALWHQYHGLEDFITGPMSDVWGKIMVTLHLASSESGAAQGTNMLTGGVILALMSVPLIVSLSEDALRAVPDSFREAALALGANPWETVRRVLFPAARNGLLAACMLGMGRAIGETMAVLLATGHNLRIPHALTDPVRTMTATIAAEMGETVNGSDHYRTLFVLGIVLFVMTCSINVAADLIIKGVKKANKV
jgi:ABC-type phosphate transport system permease subunit